MSDTDNTGNTGMVIWSLIGITVFLVFMFTLCTCCIVRCFRPQCSPGPAWYPDQYGNRRVVHGWNENSSEGYVFAKKATVENLKTTNVPGILRFRASFGHIAGFGYEAAAAS
jgi:hypothetical protein